MYGMYSVHSLNENSSCCRNAKILMSRCGDWISLVADIGSHSEFQTRPYWDCDFMWLTEQWVLSDVWLKVSRVFQIRTFIGSHLECGKRCDPRLGWVAVSTLGRSRRVGSFKNCRISEELPFTITYGVFYHDLLITKLHHIDYQKNTDGIHNSKDMLHGF